MGKMNVPLATFGESNKGLKAPRLWHKKYGDAIYAHIPHFYEMVETSEDLVVELDITSKARERRHPCGHFASLSMGYRCAIASATSQLGRERQ